MTGQKTGRHSDLFSLNGKVAWVVGAGGHLGPAICRGLAEHGAHVVMADIRPEAVEKIAQTLSDDGLSGETQSLDVGEEAAVVGATDDIVARHGRLDVLVNLTYRTTNKPMEQMSLEEWEKGTHITLGAAFVLSREAGRIMVNQGSGSIIHFASMYALVSPDPKMYPAGLNPNPPDYGAAKAGLNSLTRSIALEYGRKGIRANAIAPGLIVGERAAERLAADDPEVDRAERDCYPLGRYGRPEEIADVALFLASDESSFVTGIVLTADGGLTLQSVEALVTPRFRRRWRDDVLVPVKEAADS